MSQPIQSTNEHYTELVARQIEQYKETEIMHDLPPIFHYWSSKYNIPKLKNIIGTEGLVSFYAGYFQKCLAESDSNFLISVGSGDSSIEIAVVRELLLRGVKKFNFICLELSPILIEKARINIEAANVEAVITAEEIDINSWNPEFSFAGVMAHHSLHHILDLELLFGIIKKKLAVNGRFLTCDMVGRNGHMRWPEALAFIRCIWKKLPRKYKFNYQSNKYDDYFDNWDCSSEGFEGIRAQDILPLLVKMFSFETFFAYGNLIDIFIDRGFGPNYDPLNKEDTQFIDFIESTNEQLICDGILKPTVVFAVLRNEEIASPKIYKNWTPEFCVRDPLGKTPIYDVDSFTKRNFFILENNKELQHPADYYSINTELDFNNKQHGKGNTLSGLKFLKYGWNSAEEGCTWSSSEDASIILVVDKLISGRYNLTLNILLYHSPLNKFTCFDVLINGNIVEALKYPNNGIDKVSHQIIQIPFDCKPDQKQIEISFYMPSRRQPQYEGGQDLRALGIALVAVKISIY